MNNTPFFEMLLTNPSLALQSQEDAKCMALLSALGVLEDFTRAATPNTSTIAVDRHPTHWIFACCYTGNSEAKENGYSVVCMPRLTCSRQQFDEFVKEMIENLGGTERSERTIYRRMHEPPHGSVLSVGYGNADWVTTIERFSPWLTAPHLGPTGPIGPVGPVGREYLFGRASERFQFY